MNENPFVTKGFWITVAINAIWINASEVARYFVFVMPMMREAMPTVTGVAPMDLGVFAIWGIWDTVWLLSLSGFTWLWLERFGLSTKQTFVAATLAWSAVFVILWVGIFNMNLTTLNVVAIALPLAWLEAAIGAFIVRWGMKRFSSPDMYSNTAACGA